MTNTAVGYRHVSQAKAIRKQIETLQKRLSKLLDLYTDGNIDKNSYDTKNKERQYELDELLIKQSKINKTPMNAQEICLNSVKTRRRGIYRQTMKKRGSFLNCCTRTFI